MGQEFKRLGFVCGQVEADKCKKLIRKTFKEDLAALAGQCLEDQKEHALYQFQDWRVGLFDGFLSRAEQLRGDA